MPYAVELLFDAEGETRVRCVWKALKAAGLSSYMVDSESRPHITLAVYDSLENQGNRCSQCNQGMESSRVHSNRARQEMYLEVEGNQDNKGCGINRGWPEESPRSRIHEIRFCKRLGEFAAKWPPFTIRFGSVGTFPMSGGTVFLAPVPSEDLLMIHRYFHCCFDDLEANEWEYYKPYMWVPHCTLSTRTADSAVPDIVRLALEKFRPFAVEIGEVSLVKFERGGYSIKPDDSPGQNSQDVLPVKSEPLKTMCSFRLGTGEKGPCSSPKYRI